MKIIVDKDGNFVSVQYSEKDIAELWDEIEHPEKDTHAAAFLAAAATIEVESR